MKANQTIYHVLNSYQSKPNLSIIQFNKIQGVHKIYWACTLIYPERNEQ